MSFSYNLGAVPNIDVPRLLIADTVDQGHIFEDQEILMMANLVCPAAAIVPSGAGQASINGTPSYRYIAAALLESLAANKARLANALSVLDVKVNTQAAAQELRETAKSLRQAEQENGSFAIVEQCVDQFASRERLWKTMLRLQT
jgi:hypothetical protein